MVSWSGLRRGAGRLWAIDDTSRPMTPSQPAAGTFRSGLPYNRVGRGSRPLVVVPGLTFENKPQLGLATAMYRFLGEDYAVFSVLPRPCTEMRSAARSCPWKKETSSPSWRVKCCA